MSPFKPIFACVLKSGGDYLPEHVIALAKQVERHTTVPYQFICYTDMTIPGIDTIPLEVGHPGWWSVPEVFRTLGPTVITGIDTIISDNIDCLFEIALESDQSHFWMIKAFAAWNDYASGIMIYNGDFSYIWDTFDYDKALKDFSSGGEQEHTKACLRSHDVEIRTIQARVSGIYSYKKHCMKAVPTDARVILFHGKPRPWGVKWLWQQANKPCIGLEKMWPDSTVFILGGGPSLLDNDLSLLNGHNVLGVNQAYQIKSCNVPVCFSGDHRWWGWNKKKLLKYEGLLVTCYPKFSSPPGRSIVNLNRITKKGIHSASSTEIAWNGNSGGSAVNVAYLLGAKRIVLLGYDMTHAKGNFNWHDEYPAIKRRGGRWPNPYRRFLTCWQQIAIDAKSLGLEILNATEGGDLHQFPRVKLRSIL